MDLHKILYWKLLLKSVRQLKILLKLDRNIGTVHEDLCEFCIVHINTK